MDVNTNYLLLAAPLFSVGSFGFNILLKAIVTKFIKTYDETFFISWIKIILLSTGLVISIAAMIAGIILLVKSGIFSSILSGLNNQ